MTLGIAITQGRFHVQEVNNRLLELIFLHVHVLFDFIVFILSDVLLICDSWFGYAQLYCFSIFLFFEKELKVGYIRKKGSGTS